MYSKETYFKFIHIPTGNQNNYKQQQLLKKPNSSSLELSQ